MARKKTHAEYVAQVAAINADIEVVGQYVNTDTKIEHRCLKDENTWLVRPADVLSGKGCSSCKAAAQAIRQKAHNDAITAAFVGQTTEDGHLILEHVGYHQAPSDKKKGKIGHAKYRYRCGRCGEEGEAVGYSLKKPGNTSGCKNCVQARYDTLNKFIYKEGYGDSLCSFYIFTLDCDLLVKMGISMDVHHRGQKSYAKFPEECRYLSPLYVSQMYKRSDVWVAEQILHKEFAEFSADIPEEWNQYGHWGGQSEVYGLELDTDQVVLRFFQLMEEIAEAGYVSVYNKYVGA